MFLLELQCVMFMCTKKKKKSANVSYLNTLPVETVFTEEINSPDTSIHKEPYLFYKILIIWNINFLGS